MKEKDVMDINEIFIQVIRIFGDQFLHSQKFAMDEYVKSLEEKYETKDYIDQLLDRNVYHSYLVNAVENFGQKCKQDIEQITRFCFDPKSDGVYFSIYSGQEVLFKVVIYWLEQQTVKLPIVFKYLNKQILAEDCINIAMSGLLNSDRKGHYILVMYYMTNLFHNNPNSILVNNMLKGYVRTYGQDQIRKVEEALSDNTFREECHKDLINEICDVGMNYSEEIINLFRYELTVMEYLSD